MTRTRRRILLAASLVAGFALPSFGEGATGSVNGFPQQSISDTIEAAIHLEEQVSERLALYDDDESLIPKEIRDDITGDLDQAMMLLTDAQESLEELPGDENAKAAFGTLRGAIMTDSVVIRWLEKPNPSASLLRLLLNAAKWNKRLAQYALTQVPVSPGERSQAELNPPPPTASVDPDIKSQRKANKVSKKDIKGGRGDSLRGRGRGRRQPRPHRIRDKAKTAGDPPNWFYSFTGTSTTETGYLFKSLDRPLFGPFEVKFQVGAFDPNAEGDTGSACVEFDVEGSSPLQFLAVCGRRVSGGVQVFAQSHDGAAGNLFLAGARIAQVRVFYDGATFTCSAAEGAGAPDEALVDFATYGLVQGETALLPGIGASGLLKGAEIGLDEIYFTAK